MHTDQRISRQTLVVRYGAFALIAMFANLGAQRAILYFDQSTVFFFAALFVGTAVGLVIKYVLDSRWIFFHVESSVTRQAQSFSLYTMTGIITTAVFWGTEAAFWFFTKSDAMRELGAVIGLTIGYVSKYSLDKRFVFNKLADESGEVA